MGLSRCEVGVLELWGGCKSSLQVWLRLSNGDAARQRQRARNLHIQPLLDNRSSTAEGTSDRVEHQHGSKGQKEPLWFPNLTLLQRIAVAAKPPNALFARTPQARSRAGYRLYDEADLLRLQQSLLGPIELQLDNCSSGLNQTRAPENGGGVHEAFSDDRRGVCGHARRVQVHAGG